MSVKIRLKRMGSKKKPFYRFVAADSRHPRDGRFIETLGYYDPMKEPPDIKIKEDAVMKWMERGAKPTPNTEALFKKLGLMQKWNLIKQGVKGEELEEKLMAIKAKSRAGAGKAEEVAKSTPEKESAAPEEEPSVKEAKEEQEPSGNGQVESDEG